MTQFDPSKHSGSTFVDRAGDYLCVFDKLVERGKSKNGKPFVRLSAKVIAGPLRGRTMRETFFLNEEALWKLGSACAAIGKVQPFELSDNLALVTALCMRPFKVRMSLETVNGQTYARTDGNGYTPAHELSPGDKNMIEEWRSREAQGEWSPEDALPRTAAPGGNLDFDDSPFPPQDDKGDDIPF